MQVQVYLFFAGRCEEAVDFYKKILGAEVMMFMRFKDSPEPPQPGMIPPGSEDKVMHTCLRIGETMVMASDGRCEGAPSFQGFCYPSLWQMKLRRIGSLPLSLKAGRYRCH